MRLFAPFIAVIALATTGLAQVTEKDDEAALAAYERLIEVAKRGGYDGHKNQKGDEIQGLKAFTLMFLTGKIGQVPYGRVELISNASEFLFRVANHIAGDTSKLYEFSRPSVVIREERDIEIVAIVKFPPSIDFPPKPREGVKWVWRLRKIQDDDWRIVWISQSKYKEDQSSAASGRGHFLYLLYALRPGRDSNSRP